MTEGEKNKNLKECLEYFRERPVYKSFSQNGERNMPDWDIWAVR